MKERPRIAPCSPSPVTPQTVAMHIVHLLQQHICCAISTGAVGGEKSIGCTAAALVQGAGAVGFAPKKQPQLGATLFVGWVFQSYGIGAMGALAVDGGGVEEQGGGGDDGKEDVHTMGVKVMV